MALTKVTLSMIAGSTISVKDFGAVGDGVADDSAAVASAIAQLSNKTLVFPSGTYRLTTELIIDGHSNFTICGEGTLNTANIPTATPKENKIQFTNCSFGRVTGITIKGDITSAEITAGDDTAQLEVAQSCDNLIVDGIRVEPVATKQLCHGVGIYGNNCTLENSYITTGQEFGIIVIRNRASVGKVTIRNNTVENFASNIEPAYDTSNVFIEGNALILPSGTGNHINVWAKGASTALIENIVVSNNYCSGGASFLYFQFGDSLGLVADGIRNVDVYGNVVDGIVGNNTIQCTFHDTSNVYFYQLSVHDNTFDNMQAPLLLTTPNNSSTLYFQNISIKDNRFTATANTVSGIIQTYMAPGAYTGSTAFNNWSVTNNVFNNIGTNSSNGLIELKHTTDFVLDSNEFINTNTASGTFKDVNIGSYCGYVQVSNNATLSKIADSGSYANTVVYNNTGIVTENVGTLTIASGAAIGYAAHGLELSKLGVTSVNNGRLNITPTNASAAALSYYIFNTTATQIDFRATTNAPSDATFGWGISFAKPV